MISIKSALPKSEPKLVLFDMDGILFDTMPIHTWSWKKACDEYGIQAERDEFYLYEGMRGIDTINKLYHRTFGEYPSEETNREIYQRKTQLFLESKDHSVNRIPGTLELIKFLKEQRNCEIAVVTGSTKMNAYPRVEKFYGTLIPPELIITAEDVTNGKPHPEPYLRGMQLFQRTPSETLVVENAPLGVRSAASAGAFTIAITTGPIHQMVLREEGANLIFPNMKSLQIWWSQIFPI
ncbi:HAD family phosphatase [Porphyromonadaceae bacterium W3.11]|nr:HAD family phosphatase [Porphyromonadaceae bacterium W3.11]